jgi:hypothetical protein
VSDVSFHLGRLILTAMVRKFHDFQSSGKYLDPLWILYFFEGYILGPKMVGALLDSIIAKDII